MTIEAPLEKAAPARVGDHAAIHRGTCRRLQIDVLLRELGTGADDEVSLRHPMAFGEVVGRRRVEVLASAIDAILGGVEPDHAWRGAAIAGREWYGCFQGRFVRGLTVAHRFGTRVRVDVFLGAFPAPLRQALHAAGRDLIDAADWSLPHGTDTAVPPVPAGEVADARLRFGLDDDVRMCSPVTCRTIRGAADVRRVIGHAGIVSGSRWYGPQLTDGPRTLSLWTGAVAGLPLEVATISDREEAKDVKALTMLMRPWPVVALFQARMRARTQPFLDASYFAPDGGTPPAPDIPPVISRRTGSRRTGSRRA